MRVKIPLLILLGWIAATVAAPLLSPNEIRLEFILQGPDWNAWMGFDELGRPVLDRMIVGARLSFLIAGSVVLVSLSIGTVLGASAAWVGGFWDHLLTRIIDIFLAFPGILLAIALAGILGPGVENVIIALAAVGWVGCARLARAQTLSIKEREHVRAAISLGAGMFRILRLHVLPLLIAPLTVAATFDLAGVIIAEAGLSFLGLGVQPPGASWGTVIREGTRYMLVAPHLVIGPALGLISIVLCVNLLGDYLRDYLDVRHHSATAGRFNYATR